AEEGGGDARASGAPDRPAVRRAGHRETPDIANGCEVVRRPRRGPRPRSVPIGNRLGRPSASELMNSSWKQRHGTFRHQCQNTATVPRQRDDKHLFLWIAVDKEARDPNAG